MIDFRSAITSTTDFFAARAFVPSARSSTRVVHASRPRVALPTTIEVLCIDLDDTLYSQHEFLTQAWIAVAQRAADLGVDHHPFHRHLTRECAKGSARGGIIDRALASALHGTHTSEADASALATELVDTFRRFEPAHLTPYDGVVDTLGFLQRNCALVLITDGNPEQRRAKLRACGLGRYFDAAIFSDDAGRDARKPNPIPFHTALRALHADAAHSVMIATVRIRTCWARRALEWHQFVLLPASTGTHPTNRRPFQWQPCANFSTASRCSRAGCGCRLRSAYAATQQRDHLDWFFETSQVTNTVAAKHNVIATCCGCGTCTRT